jgi:hypothetical protein
VELKREKQFIISMIKELEADTIQLHQVMKDSARLKGIADFLNLIYSRDGKNIDSRQAYYLVRKNAMSVSFMNFSNNTLSQLKNAGNMRLIRNRSVVDSFNAMDNNIKLIERQQDNVLDAIFKVADYSTMIFSGKYFSDEGQLRSAEKIREDSVLPVFMSKEPGSITTFANKLLIHEQRLNAYHGSPRRYDKFATQMIPYLKNEYQLK